MLADGRIASSAHDSTVRVWDVDGDPEPVVFPVLGFPVAALPDGRLACSDTGGRVVLLSPTGADPPEPVVLTGHIYAGPTALAVLGDGRLVSGGADGVVRVWDPTAQDSPAHLGAVTALAVLPDGSPVSIGTDGAIRIWEAGTGSAAFVHRVSQYPVTALAVLNDGRLATAAGPQFGEPAPDTDICVWNTQEPAPPLVLRGHARPVIGLLPLPNGRLASEDGGETVCIWDPNRPETPIVRSDDGWDAIPPRFLQGALAQCARSAMLFHHHSGNGRKVLTRTTGDRPLGLAVLPDGRVAVSTGTGNPGWSWDDPRQPPGGIRLKDPTGGRADVTIEGHVGPVEVAAFFDDGRHVAVAGRDQVLRIWHVDTSADTTAFMGEPEVVLPDVRAAALLATSVLLVGHAQGWVSLYEVGQPPPPGPTTTRTAYPSPE